MAYISRNPFAREELHRQQTEQTTRTCTWCGQQRKSKRLFVYITETDGGRKSQHAGEFCSKQCHDDYHGVN